MLTALGLRPEEELIYRHLVTLPSADITEAAGATDLAPTQVQAVLHDLVANGLAVVGDRSNRFAAAPPTVALASRRVAQEERLRQAARELDDLDLVYRSVPRRQDHLGDVLDVVRGENAVRDRFVQLNASATSEVLAFVRSGVMAVTARENSAEKDAVDRGVSSRIVLEHEVTQRSGFTSEASRATGGGKEIRVAASLPTRLLVVDRRIALIPLAGRGPMEREGAMLIRPGSLLDALVALFEATWAAAPTLAQSGAHHQRGDR